MPIVTQETMNALCAVVQHLPIGTNLALLHFLWMLVNGSLLSSRGAIFPGLLSISLPPAAIRRAWAAFWSGAWDITDLLEYWREYVEEEGRWQPRTYEGYRPKAVDITAFWRPTLKNCPSKHYHPQADKALPAIIMGIIADVGQVDGHRVALPQRFVRINVDDPRESTLRIRLVQDVETHLVPGEIAVFDAGFFIRELQETRISRYVLRVAKNFTARRNVLPPEKERGRKPEYGEVVRPLARYYKGKLIPATPPGRVETWEIEGRSIRAKIWDHLVRPDLPVNPDNPTFSLFVIYDPLFKAPWLLITALPLQAASVKSIYTDRWPVEQLPLAAKQMIGAHRQFVSAPESCQRLPELALLAGSILTYLAATSPPIPTGFWDRNPQPTPGRFRRALARLPFPETYPLPGQIRKKASVTAHLLKGVLGHRRSKQVA